MGQAVKLQDWRENEGLTREQLAARLPSRPDALNVYRWETGRRLPNRGAAVEIYVLTAGAVTPNDFYELPLLEQPLERAA